MTYLSLNKINLFLHLYLHFSLSIWKLFDSFVVNFRTVMMSSSKLR